MARVDLTEPFAVRTARKAVNESMQMHGEEVIGLHMYHPVIDKGHPRCPNCYDDVYKQGESYNCTICYGTTFKGGVKELFRMWAMFDDTPNVEKQEKRGVWQPGNRGLQLEANPHLLENDYVFRVAKWSSTHHPLQLGDAYALDTVTIMSLRTGNQYVQTDNDRIGQKCQVQMLGRDHVIYKTYPRLISENFPVPRMDGLPR